MLCWRRLDRQQINEPRFYFTHPVDVKDATFATVVSIYLGGANKSANRWQLTSLSGLQISTFGMCAFGNCVSQFVSAKQVVKTFKWNEDTPELGDHVTSLYCRTQNWTNCHEQDLKFHVVPIMLSKLSTACGIKLLECQARPTCIMKPKKKT